MKRIILPVLLLLLLSCEREFEVKVPANTPLLVVEGYLNNEMPEYNYILLTRSQDYFASGFQNQAVSNARVTITEGTAGTGNTIAWDTAAKVQLTEASLPQAPENFLQGVYFDPRLLNDPGNSLTGRPGKYYLLEIEDGDNRYAAVTAMPVPVTLDSLSLGYYFNDEEDSGKLKARITLNYQDPDTLGNTLLFFRRSNENRNNFGWGGLSATRRLNGTDDVTNGQYMRQTNNQAFAIGDTVKMHMASVSREVYNFWDSFYKARNNDGPFATPIVLETNLKGTNVTGCFSGLSTSTKEVVVR